MVLDRTGLAHDLAFRFGPTSNELAWWVAERRQVERQARQHHDPVLGWRPAPGEHLTTGVVERVREDATRQTGPRGEGPRVLLVGDSFTFGVDVGDADTWAWALQAAQPTWAVIDAGIPGGSLTQAWLSRRDRGAADVVVLGLNTLMIERELESFATYRRPDPPGPDCASPAPVPAPEELLRRVGRRPKLLDLVDLATWPWRTPHLEEAWPVAAQTLGCLVADVDVPLVVAWLPIGVDLLHPDDTPPRQVKAWCADHPAVRCVDLTPAVIAVRDRGEDPWRMAHWSAPAHAAVAAALEPVIVELISAPAP